MCGQTLTDALHHIQRMAGMAVSLQTSLTTSQLRRVIPSKQNRLRYQFDSRLGPRNVSTSNHIAHGMYADSQEEEGTTDGDSGDWTDPETGNSVEDDDSTCEHNS